jgi:hypothetical protein
MEMKVFCVFIIRVVVVLVVFELWLRFSFPRFPPHWYRYVQGLLAGKSMLVPGGISLMVVAYQLMKPIIRVCTVCIDRELGLCSL